MSKLLTNEDPPILAEKSIKQKRKKPTSDSKNNTTDYKSFHYLENGSIDFSILSTKFTTKELLPGVYDLYSMWDNGVAHPKLLVNSDTETYDHDLSFLFDDKIEQIYKAFFNKTIKGKINLLGYNHKLGVILYGKQGTGKTSMFKKYFKKIVTDHDGIVFNITRFDYFTVTWDFITNVRKIQSNPIVIFIDEFEEIFDNPHNYENQMKKIMDGFESIDNSFFMLATNYINKVPDTIKKRKSRVKYSIEVKGIEDEAVISKFLNSCFDKVKIKHDFSSDLKKMKGKTVDELKQYVLDVIMNIDIDMSSEKSSIGFEK